MELDALLIPFSPQVAGSNLELDLQCPEERSDDMTCTAEQGGTAQGEILDGPTCFRGREGC
jgi:hypothetical protein